MAPRSSSAAEGVGALVLAATVFSWGFVIVKTLGLPPATLAFYRLAAGAVFLGTLVSALRLPRPARLGAPVGAGVVFGIHQLVFIAATLSTSIAVVTLLLALQPLVVSAVSYRAVGERPPPALKGWALLAASGVGVVVWANLDAPSRTLSGDLLAVLNLALVTAFFLFTKRARQQGTHTVTLTAIMVGTAMLVVAPALPFASQAVPAHGWQWALIALLALGPGNGHLLVNWAHRRVTAALASLVLTAVPLLATVWAHLVFGEPFGPAQITGFVLVAMAIEGARRAEERGRDTPG